MRRGKKMSKTIDLSIALLERYMCNNNIELTDINTFQYEVYPKMYSSHSDFGYNPAYKEFYNAWDGECKWSIGCSHQAKKFIAETLEKLAVFKESLKDNPYLANKSMRDENGKIRFSDPDFENGVPRKLHVGYINSMYSHIDVEMTVSEWLAITMEKENKALKEANEALKISYEEAYKKYGFNQDDVNYILDSLNKCKDDSLQDTLTQVSSNLSHFQRRAYISVLTSIVSSRISGLPDKYWYTTIEGMQNRLHRAS
jgi:hypothetical protein